MFSYAIYFHKHKPHEKKKKGYSTLKGTHKTVSLKTGNRAQQTINMVYVTRKNSKICVHMCILIKSNPIIMHISIDSLNSKNSSATTKDSGQTVKMNILN